MCPFYLTSLRCSARFCSCSDCCCVWAVRFHLCAINPCSSLSWMDCRCKHVDSYFCSLSYYWHQAKLSACCDRGACEGRPTSTDSCCMQGCALRGIQPCMQKQSVDVGHSPKGISQHSTHKQESQGLTTQSPPCCSVPLAPPSM